MEQRNCNCGQEAVLITSWTSLNPGRRFFRCAKYREIGGCRYFNWVDPEMCQRSKEIIPGLLRSMNTMELEIARLKEKSRQLEGDARRKKMFIFLHWVVIALLFLLAKAEPDKFE